MKFFIDTANVDEIKKANDMGIICGVTTNPSLIAKEGRDFKEVIKEITSIVDGAISGEVKNVIEEAECGVCCPIGDVNCLADSIIRMSTMQEDEREKLGENARGYCEKHFNKKVLMDYIEKYFTKGNEEC